MFASGRVSPLEEPPPLVVVPEDDPEEPVAPDDDAYPPDELAAPDDDAYPPEELAVVPASVAAAPPPSGGSVKVQWSTPHVAPSPMHLQSALVVHQPSLPCGSVPAATQSWTVADDHWQTWPPHVVVGQSVSLVQAACAGAAHVSHENIAPANRSPVSPRSFPRRSLFA